MLVLSRKPGEKLCVGKEITITILAVRGNCVRVGIEAPARVTILRSELQEGIEELAATPAQPSWSSS